MSSTASAVAATGNSDESVEPMQVTILFRGIRGQVIFFDDRDRSRFIHACSLLPSAGDFEYDLVGRATHLVFSHDSVTVEMESYDRPPQRMARFVCETYDAYFRLRYDRTGPQTDFSISD